MPKPKTKHFPAAKIWKEDDPALVGQSDRTHLIRRLHSALADPTDRTPYPAAPLPGSDIADSCAYWETAYYLMTYLLGWSNPAAGLVWFHNKNQDDRGDKLLGLLRDVWNNDG